MKMIVLLALLGMLIKANTGHSETVEEKVERWYECADDQKIVESWDNGDRDKLLQEFGEYAESIVRAARFKLHMRIDDPDAPNGWRYHCPTEYHVN